MVYVNSKKFACESCIKGHRSSSCHHTDRPLFEIKKKGRPVSQCTKCRELRQSKKFHSKCTCNHQAEEAPAMQPLAASSNSKTRRFIPIVPALPNGLRDVLEGSSSIPVPADSRQRVDSLLNPCECKSLWKCKCRETAKSKQSDLASASAQPSYSRAPPATDALSTLANAAAAMSCCSPPAPAPSSSTPSPAKVAPGPTEKDNINKARRRPGSPLLPPTKRHKITKPYAAPAPGPALAPLLYLSPPSSSSASSSSSSMIPRPMPDFPMMPPMSEISSLAGSGCTCGIKCACPGCVEHRGPTQANEEHKDCADGCATCIDESMGTALPGATNNQTSGSSVLDIFFARAAALPLPPAHRRLSFDPTDTTVYSPSSWQADTFASVNLPKLECCGGRCNCPVGQCSCRTSCAGCCDPAKSQKSALARPSNAPSPFMPVQERPSGSCCG